MDPGLQAIHIPRAAADPLLSFDPERELPTRSTGPTDVVVVTPRQTTSTTVVVAGQPGRHAATVAGRLAMLKVVSMFVAGVAPGAIVTLMLSSNSPGNAGVEEVHRAPAVDPAPPSPAPAPVIEPVSVGTAGPEVAKPVRAAVYRGSLRVTSKPAGASVFINNSLAGRTPLVIRTMPVGSRAVRVTLDGYAPWSRGVRIVANESTTVAVELHAAKTPR